MPGERGGLVGGHARLDHRVEVAGEHLVEVRPHRGGRLVAAVEVALERPVAIGLIDGYFERVPSVSHKEILWAMSQGIVVIGAASMGALRAAELAPFGMLGVGLTGLMASFMSGMAGNVTAFNTVFTYDIYQSYIRKEAPDSHYLAVGRWTTVVGIALSIATA